MERPQGGLVAGRDLGCLAEMLVIAAALVLTAHASGISNAMTVLGAQLFVWGRVAYAVLYVAGIPWARTAAWAVVIAATSAVVIAAMNVVVQLAARAAPCWVGESG